MKMGGRLFEPISGTGPEPKGTPQNLGRRRSGGALCLLLCGATCLLLAACSHQKPQSAKSRAEATNRLNVAKLQKLRIKGESGDTNSQFNIGVMYVRGQGAPQNYAEAAKWFRKAADRGDARAQANLAVMFANGEGMPQNIPEAIRWYRMAADQGN